MATLADSLVTSITNNYGGGGGGGTTPANIVNINAYIGAAPFDYGSEWVVVYRPEPAERTPVTPAYATIKHKLKVWISTPTSDDRLKEISDEVVTVINGSSFGLTGIDVQYASEEIDISRRDIPVYRMEITAFFLQLLAQSEVAFSASASAHTHDDRYYTETEVDTLLAGAFGFKTITGITNDVVADSSADTLTLASADAKLTIVGTTATDTITFTVDETQIDHDALTNFTSTEHFTLLDEDNMVSNDATKAASQQSIVAYDAAQIATHAGDGDAHHNESHTHDGDTLQLDGVNSNGGPFAFNTTGAVQFNQDVEVGGLLTADGAVPEADLSDSLGTAALTWLNLYVQDVYDAAGNQIIGTDGAGKIDALANINTAVTMESTLAVQGLTTLDSAVPEGDLVDDLGTAALTWRNLYCQDYYDAAGNQIIGTDGAGKIDALANIDTDIIMEASRELQFDTAVMHDSSNNFYMHPGAGNTDFTLTLHPLGTNTLAQLELRNDPSANYGAVKVTLNDATMSITSEAGGAGSAPTTLNINDSDFANINIGDAANQVTIASNLDCSTGLDVTGNITVTGTVDGVDVAGHETISNSLGMYQTANKAWVPCSFVASYPQSYASADNAAAKIYISNSLSASSMFLVYQLDLPTNKGGYSLHIDDSGIRLYISDADTSNYLTNIWIYGVQTDGTVTQIATDPTDYSSTGLKQPAIPAADYDCTSFAQIFVKLEITLSNNWAFDLDFVQLEVFYDT